MPLFQVTVTRHTALLTADAPNTHSFGHRLKIVALKPSFWFCVKPAAHLINRAVWYLMSIHTKEVDEAKNFGKVSFSCFLHVFLAYVEVAFVDRSYKDTNKNHKIDVEH